MQDETFRTAFTFATLLRHRTSDAARRITAISLDTAAGRVFIGLASGHVEEHEIVVKHSYALDAGPSGTGLHATTRLVAEKRVSKQPVLSLACLPTASRLAILCEDGTAFVAAYDTWNVFALQGVRTAVAIAADPAPAAAAAAARWMPTDDSDTRNTDSGATATISGSKATGPAVPAAASIPPPRPVRLAVAVKSIATVAKLLVYSIAPSVGIAANQPPAHLLAQIPLQDAVQDLTWVGSGLFVQHATSYNLLQPGGRLLRIAEHGCCQPRMASAPWPGGRGGAADGAVASGRAVTTKPAAAAAAAAAASGNYFIAISDAEGVLVYDRTSSRLVQRIFWAHDDPWVTAAKRIPVAEDAGGGGGVAVATSGVVMLLQPVAPDLQRCDGAGAGAAARSFAARELLKRKRFDAALALIRSCRQAREGWADTALAQAGLLLLQVSPKGGSSFFGISRWRRSYVARTPFALWRRSYWGLHGSLQSGWGWWGVGGSGGGRWYWVSDLRGAGLDRICDDFLELRNSTTSSPRPSPSPPASLRSSAGAGAATAAASQLLLPRGEGGGEVAALAADAKRHIVSYLLRNRGRPGVVCLEGIDTLLVHLLVDAGETAVLEAFLEARSGGGGEGGGVEGEAGVTGGGLGAAAVMAAARGPQACVSPRDTALVAALEGAGRFHALAVLRAGRGQIPQSLELWESLALGGIAVLVLVVVVVAVSAYPLATLDASSCFSFSSYCKNLQPVLPPRSGQRTTRPGVAKRQWCGGGGGGGGGSDSRISGGNGKRVVTRVGVFATFRPCLSRPLPVADVMSLLQGRYDGVRWQYMHHLVYGSAAAAAAAAAPSSSFRTELPPATATGVMAAVPRHPSGGHDGVAAAAAAAAAHACSPPPLSTAAVLAGADRGGGGGGGGGAAIVPYGSGGVAVCFASGGGGGGGGTGAAAAAATAASSVSTAELSWLGTLGLLPAAAVTRQLLLAIRAARLAAGLNPDLEQYLDLDAATAAGAGGGGAAPGGVDGISFPTAAAAAAAGGLGDSLSLLRALSRSGDGAGMGTLMGLRAVLQHHLYCSKLYDAAIVLQLHCRQGDHPAALAVLALQLADVDGAICYCRSRCGQEGWLALLDLLLRPGGGREPDYGAACRVLAAEGAALAPLQVLEALNDDMPLHLAQGTLSRMVGSVQHRKRQGQILRALHRAQNLALRAEVAHLQASRVVLTDESLCPGCQRPLTTQVFYRYPSGVVLCASLRLMVIYLASQGVRDRKAEDDERNERPPQVPWLCSAPWLRPGAVSAVMCSYGHPRAPPAPASLDPPGRSSGAVLSAEVLTREAQRFPLPKMGLMQGVTSEHPSPGPPIHAQEGYTIQPLRCQLHPDSLCSFAELSSVLGYFSVDVPSRCMQAQAREVATEVRDNKSNYCQHSAYAHKYKSTRADHARRVPTVKAAVAHGRGC
ncbi:hypothetical protein VOLCADRAFT_91994 [Volvox carteri f. nagariensis]|uniref:Vacuolar sorting protein 39/Transforming growth factor beta receptor-associated zinc finger domain-containing protein n=1 Tax=Volvox carteri f. nagariensis TaxID=3068 RepID=D8TYH3_VOLCA|nr:uncharacterized protein VOLCADRAFT_91994 [Volvox carteri f. nagariensis]EFJ47553.1 hypothetical protein VOLCADRAFT_91994 [Volvox carteri f. nagariensis]|eukprot:XP_002951377.1 hypothetical protein VOLCADRAFT_91994 [Volvox carteri f. nagariensis]